MIREDINMKINLKTNSRINVIEEMNVNVNHLKKNQTANVFAVAIFMLYINAQSLER